MKDEVLNFLASKEPKLCILATSSKTGSPESAVMGYAVLDDLTIILSTDKETRKWKNFKENKKVSLVFGWSFEELNIQCDGDAELVEGGEEYKECEESYFSVHPESAVFRGLPETVFIKVKPRWIRLSDFSADPPRIEETET